MIFYYSATGNTRYCAEYLSEKLEEKAQNILEFHLTTNLPTGKKSIGFMFPIYCWGIPPVMHRFMEKVLPMIPEDCHIWAVCTCGDEAGTAMRKAARLIRKWTGREADALLSVIMPNTYVMLPGFDVDSREVEKEKLAKAPERLDHIASLLMDEKQGVYEVKEGSLPGLRSALFPLFEKWGVDTKLWRVSDACIGCGKCAGICPAHNIEMTDRQPHWGPDCYSCCACYHVCPVHAIDYGSITRKKSQYLCPLKLPRV